LYKIALKLYKKSELNTAGKLLIRKMKPEKRKNKKRFEPYITNHDTLNNYWPEVAISYKNKSKWSKTKQNEP
jgi:hypothetical protein